MELPLILILDHRVAMSFAVAGTICDGPMEILHGDCVKISIRIFIRIFTAWETNKYPITNTDKKTCLYIKMEKAGFL